MAALLGCIHTNAKIYFDVSDVLSCSENITDCLQQFRIIKVGLSLTIILGIE